MFHRLLKPLRSTSFFLLGARGTGKSTFLRSFFDDKKTLWIDLLDAELEARLSKNPTLLTTMIADQPDIEWVVIDEVQKVPKLLDGVHQIIENRDTKFALTGSSARKLKYGSANLLAGRAFMNHLFPLTQRELGNQFELDAVLNWGALPKVVEYQDILEKEEFLKSYANTYIKEEVWNEHLIRKLDPFRRFLEVAAQENGNVINYTNVAKDVGVDTKTIQVYFELLADTLLGFFLEPYHHSIRKQHFQNPKFYFFDCGVKRTLNQSLKQILVPNTYGYGQAFEHFVIAEIYRYNHYFRSDFRLFYLKTHDQAEIDLIIQRPNQPILLIEIKSKTDVDSRDIKHLKQLLPYFEGANAMVLSQDRLAQTFEGNIQSLHWEAGIQAIFT